MTAPGGADVDLWFYRPDLDPGNAAVPWWVYMVCLDPPIEHVELGPHASAGHYCGSTDDLLARLAVHGTSAGARLLQWQRERGGSWHLVRTWPGGRWEERAIKEWKQGPKLCPECTPGTRRGTLADVARAAARIRDAQARRYAGPGGVDEDYLKQQMLAGCAARGREDAARFLFLWRDATADQIEQAAAQLQVPYYEGPRTPEGDAENAAFAEVVTATIDRLREFEWPQSVPAMQAVGGV